MSQGMNGEALSGEWSPISPTSTSFCAIPLRKNFKLSTETIKNFGILARVTHLWPMQLTGKVVISLQLPSTTKNSATILPTNDDSDDDVYTYVDMRYIIKIKKTGG